MVSTKDDKIVIACRISLLLLLALLAQPAFAGVGNCGSPVDRNDRPYGGYSDSDGGTTCPGGGGGSFGGLQSQNTHTNLFDRDTHQPDTRFTPIGYLPAASNVSSSHRFDGELTILSGKLLMAITEWLTSDSDTTLLGSRWHFGTVAQ
jgi:hypothetical protein